MERKCCKCWKLPIFVGKLWVLISYLSEIKIVSISVSMTRFSSEILLPFPNSNDLNSRVKGPPIIWFVHRRTSYDILFLPLPPPPFKNIMNIFINFFYLSFSFYNTHTHIYIYIYRERERERVERGERGERRERREREGFVIYRPSSFISHFWNF